MRYDSIRRVIALDPGGTTGWAVWSTPDIIGKNSPEFLVGEIGPEEHHNALFQHLEELHTHNTVVVCESFEFRQNRQRDNINLMSREYIGIVKLFGQQRRCPVVFQTAGLAKTFVTDPKLKAMGLWWTGQRHARDATRHLVYFMVNAMRRTDLVENWKDLV